MDRRAKQAARSKNAPRGEVADLLEALAGAISSRVLEEAPDGVLVVDWEGRILLANRQAEVLFGYVQKELNGRFVEVLLPTEERAEHRAHRAAYAAAPHRRPMGIGLELSGRRKDGSAFPAEICLSPLTLAGRQLTIAIIRDVSELRALQRERLAVEQVARAEAEARLRLLQTLMDTLPSGVYLVRGRDARLVLANRATAEVWGAQWPVGQPMEAFLATAGARVLARNGEPLPLARFATMRALWDGETVRQHQEIIRHADGSTLPVLVNAVPLDPHLLSVPESNGILQSQGGRPVSTEPLALMTHQDVSPLAGVAGVGSEALDVPDTSAAPTTPDVSEPAALVVHQDVSALYVAERLKDEFIAMATHELRNPVGVIAGYAQMLVQRTEVDPSVTTRVLKVSAWHAQALAELEQTSDRLVELTNELLDITKLQAGRLELHREPHDVAALARCVVRRMQAVATARHVLTLEVGDDEHIVVDIDARRIEQVLTNLLTNAIKYSPDGGAVTATVRSDRAADAAGVAKVAVRDEGIGIPADQQAHIFERFARALNARERQIEGTGLGLYLCRQLVELHGGRIWFESTEGVGTTFTFTLPLPTDAE